MLPFSLHVLYTSRDFGMKLVLTILAVFAAATNLLASGGENFPFHVGERLSYTIFWGPFVAGHASLEVTGIEQIDGHDCYHLVGEAHTTGLADLLYHVETKNESWFDAQEFFTRQYRERRIEGKRTRAGETHYDYDAKEAWTTNYVTGKAKSVPLDFPVQDLISSLYFVRTKPLELNVEQSFPVSVSDTNYSVRFRPDQRKTMYFRPTGEIPALRVEPNPTLNVVAANKGRMWFWISDDSRRLPLLVASDMKIGSAKLVLTKIETAIPAADKPPVHAALFGP
jgi:hypothetical protein